MCQVGITPLSSLTALLFAGRVRSRAGDAGVGGHQPIGGLAWVSVFTCRVVLDSVCFWADSTKTHRTQLYSDSNNKINVVQLLLDSSESESNQGILWVPTV